MRLRWFAWLLFPLAALVGQAFAQINIAPTTTLWKETHNNTSAANTFAAQSNGNEAVTNVSNVPTAKLLYPGATARIYAHLMTWFGQSNHMNVGYDSSDPAQVQRQVADMMRRGISGAIVDWYGPGSFEDRAVPALKYQAESHPGFEFAIMEDGGALQYCNCDVTQKVISDWTFVWNHYAQSGAYIHLNGRPVFFFFGDEAYSIDWNWVRNHVPGNPVFIFRNAGAFTRTQSNGGYSWVAPETVNSSDPMALGYLDYFDAQAGYFPGQYVFASNYKGFNDNLASWNHLPTVSQNCGQTWLRTMAEIGRYFNATHEPDGIQIVTWNDYEEGTEIESGIDNCVGVSAAVNGGWLTWSISGAQNTLDHFAVWLSTDGSHLMHLTDVPVTRRSVDLGNYAIPGGTYRMFVQAVGVASVKNHMSGAVTYVRGGGTATSGWGVTMSSPANGATVGSPVHVVASASGSHPITATWIYANSTVVFKSASASINTYLTLAPGTYTLVVQSWDSAGTVYKKSLTVTVR